MGYPHKFFPFSFLEKEKKKPAWHLHYCSFLKKNKALSTTYPVLHEGQIQMRIIQWLDAMNLSHHSNYGSSKNQWLQRSCKQLKMRFWALNWWPWIWGRVWFHNMALALNVTLCCSSDFCIGLLFTSICKSRSAGTLRLCSQGLALSSDTDTWGQAFMLCHSQTLPIHSDQLLRFSPSQGV